MSVASADRVAISVFRRFAAPRALVFAAFTEREHLVHWWGPRGCTMPTSEIELEVGGKYNLNMRGPNGEDWGMDARLTRIEPPSRLDFTCRIPHMPGLVIDTVVTFTEDGDGTVVHVQQSMQDSEASRGALQGWSQSLDKLAEHFGRQPYHLDGEPTELITTRVFAAPRSVVYECWATPAHLEHWWGPNGFTTKVHEMDLRPGGVWTLTMYGPDGGEYPNKSRFTKVIPGERIEFSHGGGRKDAEMPGANFDATILFADEPSGGTRVTLCHHFRSVADRDLIVKTYGAAEGARQTLNKFATYLVDRAQQ